MTDQRRTVRREDGRLLDVLTIGPEDGLPLIFHNGTPGGLLGFASMTSEASSRGLRTVMYGRPGYGGLTPRPRARGGGGAPGAGRPRDGGWWTLPRAWPPSLTGSVPTAS